MGVPIEVSNQSSSTWEVLAGEEEPGGREEQRTNAMVVGGEEFARGRQSGRVPLLKTLARRGWDSLFCKKVKVSLYTFYFCFVNCCNTGQLRQAIP